MSETKVRRLSVGEIDMIVRHAEVGAFHGLSPMAIPDALRQLIARERDVADLVAALKAVLDESSTWETCKDAEALLRRLEAD